MFNGKCFKINNILQEEKRTISQCFKFTKTIGWWFLVYFFFPPNREFSPFPKGSWIFREISALSPRAGWPQCGQLNFPTSGLKLYFLWQWGQILQSGNRDIVNSSFENIMLFNDIKTTYDKTLLLIEL